MTYEQALNFIHSLNRFGIKPGLERITALLNKLGNPQNNLKFIHVAGTNGKGSTSTALSNIMIAAGKKTGLYISPFVVDFRERIQINGEYIKKEDLQLLTEKISDILPEVEKEVGDKVTEFEFITALMFDYFAQNGCDIVVLEVGLGGRLDSTNVIKSPLAVVITKIALDHTAILGDTISKIATEKCGIIKEGCNVITSSLQDAAALEVIKNTAKIKNSKLYVADFNKVQKIKSTPFGSNFDFDGINITVNLAGHHQIENMSTVITAATILNINKEFIVKGINQTHFPARLEVLSKTPPVLLDGAHNDNGADVLAGYLDEHNLKPVTILGMMSDKNCEAVVSKIASRSKRLFTVTVNGNPRTETAEGLAKIAEKYCDSVTPCKDYQTALNFAAQKIKETSAPLLICGSLYLASDIRQMAINYFKK